jgi:hypothetical protein
MESMKSKHEFGAPPWAVPQLGWLEDQIGLTSVVYHCGFLAEDCDQKIADLITGKEVLSPAAKYLRKIRAVFYAAQEDGLVHLVQRRRPKKGKKKLARQAFEYRAEPVPAK